MASDDVLAAKRVAEAKIPRFAFERLLKRDQEGRRLCLLGSIDDAPAILLVERGAFSDENQHLSPFAHSLQNVRNLGANDIYAWYLASTAFNSDPAVTNTNGRTASLPDLKLNLIHPCTEKHIKKYSVQPYRVVTETPEIYEKYIRPYMEANRAPDRLGWVFNIIEGRTEQEDVIYRQNSKQGENAQDGFLLLPDLNWDRQTITSMHLLGLVERRDIWSVRDLTKGHAPWLKLMRRKILDSATKLYPQVEEDQIKLYVHYQPTYYHFHIHVVHVMLEGRDTQAVGKALSLDNVISQLETMHREDAGMKDVTLTYNVGEASDLWKNVFEPLKRERNGQP